MKVRAARFSICFSVCLGVLFAALPMAAGAGQGLVPPAADALWPQWKVRIAVQTASVSPLNLSRLLEGSPTPRSWQGAALLGDYYFATPAFGSFRASGGLMVGSTGGAPLLPAATGSRIGLSVQASGFAATPGAESAATVPYLGLGFTSASWWDALSVTADVGWVAEQPSAAGAVGRAIFGNQGKDNAWRELRLSPVLQVGVRYAF